jgi:sortase B
VAGSHKTPAAAKALYALAAAALLTVAVLCVLLVTQTMVAKDIRPSPAMSAYDTEDGFPVVDWAYWQAINPDVIAWVTVPGTGIDTPIVQAHADAPEYYLSHDIYGNWSYLGCPYLDASKEADGLASLELLIYGHNTGVHGLQFYDLQYYRDYGYALSHSTVLFQSPDEKKRLTVQAADIVNAGRVRKVTDFPDVVALRSWYQEQYDGADVRLGDERDITQLYTFVTCSYNFTNNERTVVYAA